jgi:plasmid stabilization system protein ParE
MLKLERTYSKNLHESVKIFRFPYLGRSHTYIRPEMRGILLGSYIIFCQVVDDGIKILRMVGECQDLDKLFSEL